MGRILLGTIVAANLVLAGCTDKLGQSCEIPGVMNDEVATVAESEECGGATCMFLEGYGTFCTDNCMENRDCPNGFECVEVDLLPSDAQQLQTMCIPDEPIDPGDDDDDSTPPVGTPPVISELQLWHEVDTKGSGGCVLWHGYHWHDEDGDLNGADAYATFVDVDDPKLEHDFFTNIEVVDTVDIDLQFRIDHDGDPLLYSHTYSVYVEIKDRAGNLSNQLAQGGYTTPNASCE